MPIVASISRELFLSVPSELKQGAMALGATRWEMVRSVMLPYVSGGLVAYNGATGRLESLNPANEYATNLFTLRNSSPDANVRLTGTQSNRDAVGARLRLRTAQGMQTREVHAGSAYLSGQSLVQHFGLGDEAGAAELDVSWPSGGRTALTDLPADRRYVVVEGVTGPEPP